MSLDFWVVLPERLAVCGLDEGLEEGWGVATVLLYSEVELSADKPRMARDLDDFDQVGFRMGAGRHHALLDEAVTVGIVELVAVPVALLDVQLSVAAAASEPSDRRHG